MDSIRCQATCLVVFVEFGMFIRKIERKINLESKIPRFGTLGMVTNVHESLKFSNDLLSVRRNLVYLSLV